MFLNSKEFSEFFVCLCCSIFKELLAFALVSVSLVSISLSHLLVNTFFQTFFQVFSSGILFGFEWLLSATLTVYHFLNFLSIPFQNFFSLFCSVFLFSFQVAVFSTTSLFYHNTVLKSSTFFIFFRLFSCFSFLHSFT